MVTSFHQYTSSPSMRTKNSSWYSKEEDMEFLTWSSVVKASQSRSFLRSNCSDMAITMATSPHWYSLSAVSTRPSQDRKNVNDKLGSTQLWRKTMVFLKVVLQRLYKRSQCIDTLSFCSCIVLNDVTPVQLHLSIYMTACACPRNIFRYKSQFSKNQSLSQHETKKE